MKLAVTAPVLASAKPETGKKPYIVLNSDTYISTYKELYDCMVSQLEYGLFDDHGNLIPKDGEQDYTGEMYMQHYKYSTVATIMQRGGGVCWDKTLVAMYYLKGLKVHATEIYTMMTFEPDYPSHTTILITDDKTKKVYIFETSWSSHHGIHGPYDTEREAMEELMKWECELYPAGSKFECWKVITPPKPGDGVVACMKAYAKGQKVFEHNLT